MRDLTYNGHISRPRRETWTTRYEIMCRQVVKNALPLWNRRELRFFLGMCKVYRCFVHIFAHIARPLNAVLQKGTPKAFDELAPEQLFAFHTLLEALTSAQVMHLPQLHQPYSIDRDASDYRIGCVLFQTNEENIRGSIGYFSQTSQAAKRNYFKIEKEYLAVLRDLQTLRPYLAGN